MSDSDLYGDDIRLWFELLGTIAPGEARRAVWAQSAEEIEEAGLSHNEIARLTARLSAAEALVNELRARLDQLTSRLSDTQAELAGAQDEVEAATARALAAAQAEQAVRQADAERRARGRWAPAQGSVARD